MQQGEKRELVEVFTLSIYGTHNLTESENNYIKALKCVFQGFQRMSKNNNFFMRLKERNMLIGCHASQEHPDPLIFLYSNADNTVSFKADMDVFSNEVEVFKEYISYYGSRDMSDQEKLELAIRDYKNDKLDFNANSPLIMTDIIERARLQFQEELDESTR